MLKLGGLTESELEEACSGPVRDKTAIFRPAKEWYKRNKAMLSCAYPESRYVIVDAITLSGAFGKNHDDAAKNYKTAFGPTPTEGREFFGMQL